MARVIGGRKAINYERVTIDEWLTGRIEEVQYDEHRAYRVKNQETEQWETATAPHVRFKFKLDGYQFPHYSRWMKASTNEKSNLYGKYLKYLCPKVDCLDKPVDLDKLTGAKVRVMWENNGDYQNVTQIRGVDEGLDILAADAVETTAGGAELPDEGEEGTPF